MTELREGEASSVWVQRYGTETNADPTDVNVGTPADDAEEEAWSPPTPPHVQQNFEFVATLIGDLWEDLNGIDV